MALGMIGQVAFLFFLVYSVIEQPSSSVKQVPLISNPALLSTQLLTMFEVHIFLGENIKKHHDNRDYPFIVRSVFTLLVIIYVLAVLASFSTEINIKPLSIGSLSSRTLKLSQTIFLLEVGL